MKSLTFLIPCYNVEHCIGRCLSSLLVEPLLDDIEVLLVDDGSHDGTAAILDSYHLQYPATVRVIHKENGGWGTAINTGIQHAAGKYIKELDADDWVTTENLAEYIDFLKNNDIDYIATEYSMHLSKEGRTDHIVFKQPVYGRTMTLDEFWNNHPDTWEFPIHAITYKTSFLRDINLTVGDRYYCDFEYFLYSMPHVGSVHVLPLNITVYFRGDDNQSTGTLGYARHYRDMADLSLRLAAFYDGIPDTLNDACRKTIFRTIAGTVELSYELMMSPVYAGRESGIDKTLRAYDHRLRLLSKTFYKEMNRHKKRGIPYITLWRKTGVNILSFRKQ